MREGEGEGGGLGDEHFAVEPEGVEHLPLQLLVAPLHRLHFLESVPAARALTHLCSQT